MPQTFTLPGANDGKTKGVLRPLAQPGEYVLKKIHHGIFIGIISQIPDKIER